MGVGAILVLEVGEGLTHSEGDMIMEKIVTNKHGNKFLIERGKDFDENGRFIDGNGWFASQVVGNDILSGIWFETEQAALNACADYKG